MFEVNFEYVLSKLAWATSLALGGISFLVLLWVFQSASFDFGIYGLLMFSCACIFYLSIINPSRALLAGIFATPLITIQYKLPILGMTLSFDKLFLVSFSLVWLFRSLINGSIRHLFHVPILRIAWLLTLTILGVSFAIGWTQEEHYLIHTTALLEPLFIALFFFASCDVMRNDLGLPFKMIQALLISSAIVLFGSTAQLTVEFLGITPPRLALLAGEGIFPYPPRFSTIAHPNYMATYTTFAIALGIGSMADNPRKSWVVPFWIVVAGMLIIYAAKSLGGLSLLLIVVGSPWLFGRFSVSNSTSNSALVLWVTIFGVFIVSCSTLLWGISKLSRAASFSIRAYPYKVVLPGIQGRPFFGSGPGSYLKIFQLNERKIPFDKRPASRRLITRNMLRRHVRPSKSGVTLAPGKNAVWLKYEINNPSWVVNSGETQSLLEGVVARARVRTSQPGAGRIFIQFNGKTRSSSPNNISGSQILFAPSILRLKGIPGWKHVPDTNRQSVRWTSTAEYSDHPALRVQNTPFEMKLNLEKFPEMQSNPSRNPTVRFGAWVKRSKDIRKKYKTNTFLLVTGYDNSFDPPELKKFHTYNKIDHGNWHFITTKMDTNSNRKISQLELCIKNETVEKRPLLIGGIFLHNGTNIFSLLPKWRQPPTEFMKGKPFLSALPYVDSENSSHLKYDKLTVGMVAEPRHGPVHFDQLQLNSSNKSYFFPPTWKDLYEKINRPGTPKNILPFPWNIRIEGWSNKVPPGLSAHSIFLSACVERGLLGLLSIIFLYGAALWEIKKRGGLPSIWNSYVVLALSVFLLSSIIEDTLLILRFSILFWALTAAALVGNKKVSHHSIIS